MPGYLLCMDFSLAEVFGCVYMRVSVEHVYTLCPNRPKFKLYGKFVGSIVNWPYAIFYFRLLFTCTPPLFYSTHSTHPIRCLCCAYFYDSLSERTHLYMSDFRCEAHSCQFLHAKSIVWSGIDLSLPLYRERMNITHNFL